MIKKIKQLLSENAWFWLKRRYRSPLKVCLGSFRRLLPISSQFGFDRGLPIDRYYIEAFLKANSKDIRGSVLEVAEAIYTKRFGSESIEEIHVLHATRNNPQAKIIGNLATGEGIPVSAFDCMILTQTLHVIYDIEKAVANSYAALKPGGVLLATLPGISQISRYDMDHWGDYWRLTDASANRLFEKYFGASNIRVQTHGNVLTACAFLHGLAVQELKPRELAYNDPDYQLLITIHAVKK